ncbi:MAG: PilZ domain-containing protein [Nitrospira sp.]|nr:PilZ domain-containing protein [Nitrospira sp.]
MHDSRSSHRYPVAYPVIFRGAPFVGEGTITDLSLRGCSIVCDRTVLADSDVKLSVIFPDPTLSLFIELGKIRWVRKNVFGVEFLRMPTITRHRLDHVLRQQGNTSVGPLPDQTQLSKTIPSHQSHFLSGTIGFGIN